MAAVRALALELASRRAARPAQQARLRYFYLRFPHWTPSVNRGGLWVWCPACRRFVHGSGPVPDWWRDVPGVTVENLSPEPEVLERRWDRYSRFRAQL